MGISKLSPSDKTAILMLALGENLAAEILKHMKPDEVKKIGSALSRTGQVKQETMDLVLGEFMQILKSGQPELVQGGFDIARNVIDKAFNGDSKAQGIIHDLAASHIKIDALEQADAATIYRIIANEHPQTIAIIVTFAKPKQAGEIIRLLPESLRTEVITRVTSLGEVTVDLVQEIDDFLSQEIQRAGMKKKNLGGVQKAAAILNAMSQDRSEILDQISERDPDLSQSIKQNMFIFEDLAKLEPNSMSLLFKSLPSQVWVLALRGADKSVLDAITASMSQRAAQTLTEDIEVSGPQAVSKVEEARRQILDQALSLAEQEKIILNPGLEQVV